MRCQAISLAQVTGVQEEGTLYCQGNVSLLVEPSVAIIGSRKATPEGLQRARRLAKELCQHGVVVMSGLALGIDTASHHAAMRYGQTVAVIGTSLDQVYPSENEALQKEIAERHLVVSPFPEGNTLHRLNFPARNRLMAKISRATVIVEASDTSGTLYQATECVRRKSPLFITRSAVEHPSRTWPSRFLREENRVFVLDDVCQILREIERVDE